MEETPAAPRLHLLAQAWRHHSLRRLCLAIFGFRVAELAVWISLTAYAYSAGGVGEASAVIVAELVPATAFALAVGGLIRRHGAGQVLRWGLVLQSAGMIEAAVFLHRGANLGAYVGAIVAATAITTTRPAQSALMPSLVDGPEELTAANVLSGVLLAVAGLVGPAAAALLMAAVGAWAVFAVMAAVAATSAAAVWRLPPVHAVGEEDPESLRAGLRAIARAPGPRVMVVGVAVYYLVIGALDVLSVVIAVELLGKSESYSGFLTTAVGVGAVVAGGMTMALIGRRWIAPWILVSAFAIGVTLVAVSLAGSRVAASIVILVIFGIATTIYELTALMLLQRVSRLDLLGHVFALVESLQMAMLAVGAAIVPLAVEVFGFRWAPAAIGALFVALVAGFGTRVIVIDRHARVPITEMAALRSTPLFAALPGPALETVAREARRVEVAAGEVVVREGEPGTEYFAVISGRLVVIRSGEHLAELTRGAAFGEIALIREVPRTATVRAATDAVLLAVDREPFLTAVTGHRTTHERASSIAAAHLDPPS
jgi:MFS family permease